MIVKSQQSRFEKETGPNQRHSGVLVVPFTDYIDGARLYLETVDVTLEGKDFQSLQSSVREIKIHFSTFIRQLVRSFPREYHLKCTSSILN